MGYLRFLNNYFFYASYFYDYLKFRLPLTLLFSILVGFFDGIGLALFIPLLELISNSANPDVAAGDDVVSSFIVNFLKIEVSFLNIFLLILFFFSLKGVAKFFEGFLRIKYQQYFMRKVRVSNIDLLSSYDYELFVTSDAGRIQNTFSAEVTRVNTAYKLFIKSIQMGVLVCVYIVLAFSSDWKFSAIVMAGGFFMNLTFKMLYSKTKTYSKQFTKHNSTFQNLLLQKVQLFKYLKSTGLSKPYGEKLKKNISEIEGVQRKIGFLDAVIVALREPLAIIIVFLAILLNIYFFDKTMGTILLSLLLLYRAITYFMGMQEHYNLFLGVSGSIENLRSFTDELRAGKEETGSKEFSGFHNSLNLNSVGFEFKSGTKILENINLIIKKNETVAIVGESGAGKTTLLNIISGLLKPSNGNYLIDGIPIDELDLSSFKRRVGYIVQDAAIFNDTIYNNITFWAPKTEENLLKFDKAVKKAAIYDFIQQLPQREETSLGNNGINISGGQKQRFAIARELFKEVDFLFMDEATSSLDSETEAAIQHNINSLKGKYTIVIIAHRISTVKVADRIIMLKNGRLQAEGDFQSLSEGSIDFQEMLKHQIS